MISYIKGTLTAVGESEVIVEAGSFGIEVKTSREVIDRLPAPGKELILYTHFKLSEDAVALYGFDREADLRLFRALIAVSGIGPKGALAVLSALEPEALKLAVLSGDAKAIAKAPGVGIRTAERIILESCDGRCHERAVAARLQCERGSACRPCDTGRGR